MTDEYRNTRTRQTSEQPEGGDERVPEVTQPPRRGRHSRACIARNMEVVVEQMLEMKRQQVTQTVVLNAYLQHGLMPPAPPVYPPYQSKGYEYQREGEEEDPYSYTSLDRSGATFWENDGIDPSQYPYHGYNSAENYGNPNLPPKNSQELETSQGFSVSYRLGNRPPRNRRESRAANALPAQTPHVSTPYQY
ncbi:hypothetical protein Fot_37430 [Forsythia ovata]|uniref:Uncharacterized protein n=1 Tax=Forsythia ovata TaxID=205694 RepID=A0ABD1S152_9LAMI